MSDYNMLSIEELISVIESLPRITAGYNGTCDLVIGRDDLIGELKNLREMRQQSKPSTEDLEYALRTGDCSRLERKAS